MIYIILIKFTACILENLTGHLGDWVKASPHDSPSYIDPMGDSTCYQGPKSKTNRYITRVLLRGPDKNFGKHSVVGYYYM